VLRNFTEHMFIYKRRKCNKNNVMQYLVDFIVDLGFSTKNLFIYFS
jgi:hypothetical protein